MQKTFALVSLIYSMAISAAPDITLPIHPDEAKLVKAIIAIEGHAVEVAEVPGGQECGMAFQNYEDMRVGDVIECFRVEQIARSL